MRTVTVGECGQMRAEGRERARDVVHPRVCSWCGMAFTAIEAAWVAEGIEPTHGLCEACEAHFEREHPPRSAA